MRFKLISYNIFHGTYIDEVADFLEHESQDIVCLQEVGTKGRGFIAGDENNFELLKQRLRMNGVHADMFQVKMKENYYNLGVCILTTGEISSSKAESYAGEHQTFEEDVVYRYISPSVVLSGEVELNETRLRVVTTHLPVTHKTAVTERQLEAARSVKRFADKYEEYILCGDMNTLPGSETYTILQQDMIDATDPQVPTLHPRIHKVGGKGYHVDYVFYAGTRITGTQTRIPVIDASDHLPVVVEFELED